MKDDRSPLKSLIAGATAGSIEAFITYPAEFLKTRLQLQKSSKSPLLILKDTINTQGVRGVYQGCSTAIVGTSFKAGVRFLAFDTIRKHFKDSNDRVTPMGGLVAGLVAGVTESILAVTPFETIKTALIEDSKKGIENRQYHGFINGSRALLKEKGFRGVYKGVFPVTLRQTCNAAVRMGMYSYLTESWKMYKNVSSSSTIPNHITFIIGALTGVITVYTTMPLDTIKTRMQKLDSRSLYSSTFDCARKVFKNEGLLVFWSGAVPRLCRLGMSGGIVFTVYEKIMTVIN